MTRRFSKGVNINNNAAGGAGAWETATRRGCCGGDGVVKGLVVVVLVLLQCTSLIRVAQGLSDDGIALLAFKRSISSDPFRVLANWNEQDADPCSWCGVTCSAEYRVTALSIPGVGLQRIDDEPGCKHHGDDPFSSAWSSSECQVEDAARLAMSRCSIAGDVNSTSRRVCTAGLLNGLASAPICLDNGTVLDGASSGYTGGQDTVVPCLLSGSLPREIGNLSDLAILSLPFNGLSGEVPREIGKLKYLETLDLEANSFSGVIPPELGQLSKLRVLNLEGNNLQGSIPADLSKSGNLCYVSLAKNTLRGKIPPSLGSLLRLQWMSLSSNLLDGEIPSQLGSGGCLNLDHLDLANNYLTGAIPPELGNCTQLQSLLLNSNSLVGSIPADLGRLSKLEVLHLALNNLSGLIPRELSDCTQLSTFIITLSQGCSYGVNCSGMPHFADVHRHERNHFWGSLPPQLALLPRIQVIWAPSAGLSGTLPVDWGLCSTLESLNLAKNSLTGPIPTGLSGCRSLVVLDLSSNQLNGTIPPQLPISCLAVFNISSNTISGSIPVTASVCSNPWLLSSTDRGTWPFTCFDITITAAARLHYDNWKWLGGVTIVHDFSSNLLTGPLPGPLVGSALIKKQASYVLVLSNNEFEGSVPGKLFSLCQGLQAFAVNLSFNLLSGELPLEFGDCEILWYFDAVGNKLTGSVPDKITSLTNLVFLNLAYNQLQGAIPWQLGGLQNLEGLILANNQLTGSIPAFLGNLSKLVVLDLSFNSLKGNIPKELGKLSQLRSLLLNNNSLSGSIPKELSSLTSLEQLNLTFNNLSGQFPVHGHWGGLCSTLVVMGNPFLLPCTVATAPQSVPILVDPQKPGDAPTDSDSASPPASQSAQPHFNSIVVAAITSGCAIGVVLLVLGLLFQCTKQHPPTSPNVTAGRKEVVTFYNINFHLTYDKVVRATHNFCLDNLIGTGGFGATYKAELRPGLVVAVKRLAIGRFQGVQQFDTEIRTLGRIRHPNLVTLIGYHASEEEMFLIYNYFPEGNLETLIHICERGRKMNWSMRHKIALDLARALAYLHDECVPRVLHRDIKPSNVLLDHDLNAHLSDFGLARLLGDAETHATTDVAGTFGYVAPEYAMTCRVSDKADVYSYGVVLLELLSGKRALDITFSKYGDGFNIVGWATLLIHHNRPHEVFAPGLWETGPESDLLKVLQLAVMCTEESLSERPTMRQVVERLRSCHPPAQPLPS